MQEAGILSQDSADEKDRSRDINEENLSVLITCMKEKDRLIEQLLARISSLEEKFLGMQREKRRDKSSQRVNNAIKSLEQKLEQFSR